MREYRCGNGRLKPPLSLSRSISHNFRTVTNFLRNVLDRLVKAVVQTLHDVGSRSFQHDVEYMVVG